MADCTTTITTTLTPCIVGDKVRVATHSECVEQKLWC